MVLSTPASALADVVGFERKRATLVIYAENLLPGLHRMPKPDKRCRLKSGINAAVGEVEVERKR